MNTHGTGRAPLVHGFVGLTLNDLNRAILHIELIGHDLGQRHHQTLPQIDLAKEGRYFAICTHRNPRVQLIGLERRLGGAHFSLRVKACAKARDAYKAHGGGTHHQGARGFEPVSSRQGGQGRARTHGGGLG